MIVALYADRRTRDVAVVAHDLALALRSRSPRRAVALFVDDVATRSVGNSEFVIAARELPRNLRIAVAAHGDADHLVLGLTGPVTEQVVTAFDLSQRIVVVTDSAVGSVRTAQRTFRFCASVGYPAAKVLAVHLHGGPEDAALDCASIAKALRRDVFCGLPRGREPMRRAAYTALAGRVLGT